MELIKRVLGFHKSPPVLVESCLYELNCVINNVVPPKGRRLNKRFCQMKNFLFGKGELDPEMDECEDLAKEIIDNSVILSVIKVFPLLTLQERNSFVQVVSTLLTRDHAHFASSYMLSEEGNTIIDYILKGFDNEELSVHSGILLRECIKCRCIHEHLLTSIAFMEPLFTYYAFNPHFDISSDVLQVICDLLRKNKQLVMNILSNESEICNTIFGWLRNMIQCTNYVVLLSVFLSDQVNIPLTLIYLEDKRNLMVVMNLLCSPYQSLQLNAFNIFKLFVANNRKTLPIKKILAMNRVQLIVFLSDFLPDNDDDAFIKEKKVIISILNHMVVQ